MSYYMTPFTDEIGTEVEIEPPSDEVLSPDLGISVQWNNENEALIHKVSPIVWTISLSWEFITEAEAQKIIDIIEADGLEYIVYECSVGTFHCRVESPSFDVRRIGYVDSFSTSFDLKGIKQ